MKICQSILRIPAVTLTGENPLPFFRDKNHSKELLDKGLLKSELEGFGYETGFRALPYQMQDRYTRELRETELRTVVLENDCLKATFLADFGGRLWSLYDKRAGKELLFKNPVFRVANLAIRNAWFSGGIEWNLGQLGHTCFTCEPVFFARCVDNDGTEFLRMYEYERQKCLFLQIDFHLPDGAEFLAAHVSIQNKTDRAVPLYFWTNIAVPENRNVRVYSGTKEVIYISPETQQSLNSVHGFAHGEMPYLKTLGGLDASYPQNIPYSSEYFFQNPAELERTWEAAAYDDGSAFWERSTPRLRYRKMFCWGSHRGGDHWKHFLSDGVRGEYLEIQGGLAPTQVHGENLEAGKAVSFTQVFGGCSIDREKASDKWEQACGHLYSCMETILSAKELAGLDKAFAVLEDTAPSELLYSGSGWGALEAARDSAVIPKGMYFPKSTLGERQRPWLTLLEKGALPPLGENEQPTAWMADPRWLALLEASLQNTGGQNGAAYLHAGVMLVENDRWQEGIAALERSLELCPTAIACCCAAKAYQQQNDLKKACDYIEYAVKLGGVGQDTAIAEEYVALYNAAGQWEKAWSFYERLSDAQKAGERLRLNTAETAFALHKWEFLEEQFAANFATIREGESTLIDLWFQKQALTLAEQRGVADYLSLLDEVKATLLPPYNLDFRMTPPKQQGGAEGQNTPKGV